MNPANPVEQAALDSDVEKCVQCGKCTAGCPSGRQSRLRTRMLVQLAYQGRDVTDMKELWDCTTCYNCAERCPKGVNTVDAVIALRNLAVRKGNFPRVHLSAIENLYNTGNGFPLSPEVSQIRAIIGLPKEPYDVSTDPEELDKVRKLMDITGLLDIVRRGRP
ncbi:MAG: 4Fe-4S dicluster domain-containing protein [Theionarchaea archaeon]|nr:4Fe-4S dicluster domain-containing protein [Theionarchaea archaeon]